MPKLVATPIRRETIMQSAERIRNLTRGLPIEEVARKMEIILTCFDDPEIKIGGYAYVTSTEEPLFVDSLARDGGIVRVLGASKQYPHRAIVINRGYGLSDAEVFWHEFYHLFFSPESRDVSTDFRHVFSTEGALHAQEERRANEFAAAILIEHIESDVIIEDLMCQYCVSRRVAEIRVAQSAATRNGNL